jgi:hypothetical protein
MLLSLFSVEPHTPQPAAFNRSTGIKLKRLKKKESKKAMIRRKESKTRKRERREGRVERTRKVGGNDSHSYVLRDFVSTFLSAAAPTPWTMIAPARAAPP